MARQRAEGIPAIVRGHWWRHEADGNVLRGQSTPSCELEGSVADGRASVVVYGDASCRSLRQLDSTLEAVVARRPPRLTIDLSETTGMDVAMARTIARWGRGVAHLDLVLPEPARASGRGGGVR